MPETLILAFDTSAAHCAAALLRGDDCVAAKAVDIGRGQAEMLFPLLEEVLAAGGARWADLAAIGVGTGPGNFTGIRIAVSAARGLALGLGIPAIGVSGFEAAALGKPRPVTVALPAPRDQVYLQTLAQAATAPRLAPRAEAGNALPGLAPAALVLAIGRIAHTRWQVPAPRPAPVYVRPADAAPPRDPAPVILA